MSAEKAIPPIHPTRKLIVDWLFTINLFFILYSLATLFGFLLGPESGRLTTLQCKVDPWGYKVCTVKIYGIWRIYRKDFLADDYYGVLSSSNFYDDSMLPHLDLALPWDNVRPAETSGEIVCAVSLQTSRGLIDFVPPYHESSDFCSNVEERVRSALAGDRTAINLQFNGYSPGIYRQLFVLFVACLLFVVQCVYRFRRRGLKQVQGYGDEQKQSVPFPDQGVSLPQPNLLLSKVESSLQKGSKQNFILLWWIANALVFAFMILASWITGNYEKIDSLGGCFLYIGDYQSLYVRYPVTNLVCIAPLFILLTMGAMLQWQLLKTRVRVSAWWIAAPLIAAIPLLFTIHIGRSCSLCRSIGFTMLFLGQSANGTNLGIYLAGYYLLIGLIQWLVLRRVLRISPLWNVFPLAVVFVANFPMILLFFLLLIFTGNSLSMIIMLPFFISLVAILSMLVSVFSLVPGWYLQRAIWKRKARQGVEIPA